MNLIEDRAWRWASATNHEWAVVQPLRPTSNPLPASTWARPAAAAGLRAGGSSAPGALSSASGQGHSPQHRDPGADQVSVGMLASDQKSRNDLWAQPCTAKTFLPTKRKKLGERWREGEREKNTWPRPDRVNQLSLPTSGQMLIPCSLVTSQEWTLNCSNLFEGSEAGSGDISTGTC